MALTANRQLKIAYSGATCINDVPVKGSTTIYQGAFVGDASGLARGLVAADAFMGIALSKADNSAGSDSAITCRVVTKGTLKRQTVTGASTVDHVNTLVYASADDTLTLTSSSNTLIGVTKRFNTDDSTFDVEFIAASDRVAP